MRKILAIVAAFCLSFVLVSCAQQAPKGDPISEDQLKSIVFEDAGVDESQIATMNISYEVDDGWQKYDVAFVAGSTQYEYVVEAVEGTIIEKEISTQFDFTFGDDASGSSASATQDGSAAQGAGDASGSAAQSGASTAAVTQDQAAQTVLARVPGATTSNLVIYYEVDDGRAKYEGHIVYNAMEYDFEVDAITGEVIEWEQDSVYD